MCFVNTRPRSRCRATDFFGPNAGFRNTTPYAFTHAPEMLPAEFSSGKSVMTLKSDQKLLDDLSSPGSYYTVRRVPTSEARSIASRSPQRSSHDSARSLRWSPTASTNQREKNMDDDDRSAQGSEISSLTGTTRQSRGELLRETRACLRGLNKPTSSLRLTKPEKFTRSQSLPEEAMSPLQKKSDHRSLIAISPKTLEVFPQSNSKLATSNLTIGSPSPPNSVLSSRHKPASDSREEDNTNNLKLLVPPTEAHCPPPSSKWILK